MKKKELMKIILEHNFNIAVDALDYLIEINITEEILRELIKRIPMTITVLDLETVKKFSDYIETTSQIIKEKPTIQPDLEKNKEEIPLNIRLPASHIKIKADMLEKIDEKPKISLFRQLFRNRYKRLSNILIENIPNSERILPINTKTDEINRDKHGILIGMVQDTRVLHTNKFVIQLENPETETITNCVMVQDSINFPEYRSILRDTVIGVSGLTPKNYKGGDITTFWGKEILRPSFKPIEYKPTSDSHKILFIADIHFGSKYFSRSIFAKLIKFLTIKDIKTTYRNIAREISTIIIAGDLVDGIGHYVDQKNQISFNSLKTQYDNLSKLLMEIPSHIQIIVIPGEHDATQTALPQPAIDKNIGKALLSIPNLKNQSNPLRLSIHGLNFLIFHGQTNYSLIYKKEKQKYLNPIVGIKNLLEYRHLCPEYGATNPLAPFKKDYLVIDKIPEVIVTGHFHQARFEEYKGVKIITCGTFKREERNKLHLGGEVTVGKIPILDTETGNVTMIDLKEV